MWKPMSAKDWDWERVDATAERCLRSTLTEVGYAGDTSEEPGRAMAAVQLAGTLSGRIVLTASGQALALSCPVPCEGNEELVRDWACELVNLVVGRLRTEMAGYGVRLDLATPQRVSSAPPPSMASGVVPALHAHTFHLGEIAISLRVDAVRIEDAVATPEPANDDGDGFVVF
jgi:CheY-specific phosphatase CheX